TLAGVEFAIADQALECRLAAPGQFGRWWSGATRIASNGYLGGTECGDLCGHGVEGTNGIGSLMFATWTVAAIAVAELRVGEYRGLTAGAEDLRVGHDGAVLALHAITTAPFVGAAVP